jgi:mannosyltransferase
VAPWAWVARVEPWLAGITATVVAGALSWRPSFWFDEAATIASANRSEADILRMLVNFDAVHAAYYLAMHAWFGVVPINEFTARLPSVIAVGLGAAGMVVLGRMLGDRVTSWTAAAAYIVMPRILWAAVEARSYAFTVALAVWLTVAFVHAATRGGAAAWGCYALLLTVSTVTFVYLSLMVAVHLLALPVLRARIRCAAAFGLATIAGLAVAWPVVALGYQQRHQLSWIPPSHPDIVDDVLLQEWFVGSEAFAVLAATLLLVGAVFTVVQRKQESWQLLAVAIPWTVVPASVILGYAWFINNLYQPRYLTFSAPGVALLLAAAMRAITRGQALVGAAVAVALLLAATPVYLTERGRFPKPDGEDLSAVADVVGAGARAGDCFAFEVIKPHALRAAAAARPDAFAGLTDVTAGQAGPDVADLFPRDLPLNSDTVAHRLAGCRSLWAVFSQGQPSPVVDRAVRAGFAVDRRWPLNVSEVVRLVKADNGLIAGGLGTSPR